MDTGFLVFNERTYPGLIALLDELQVPSAHSDMSFSVQVPGAGALGAQALEWSGSNLATVFAQRRNLLRPRFWGMLRELLRFNQLCTTLAESGEEAALAQPLGNFLAQHGFGTAFRDWYFLPMLGCIWSCPTDQMLRFPVATKVVAGFKHADPCLLAQPVGGGQTRNSRTNDSNFHSDSQSANTRQGRCVGLIRWLLY